MTEVGADHKLDKISAIRKILTQVRHRGHLADIQLSIEPIRKMYMSEHFVTDYKQEGSLTICKMSEPTGSRHKRGISSDMTRQHYGQDTYLDVLEFSGFSGADSRGFVGRCDDGVTGMSGEGSVGE